LAANPTRRMALEWMRRFASKLAPTGGYDHQFEGCPVIYGQRKTGRQTPSA